MKLYNRLNSWLRRRKPRTEQSAVEARIEQGRKDGTIKPYLGPVLEDDAGIPSSYFRTKQAFDDDLEGLVGEWRAPV